MSTKLKSRELSITVGQIYNHQNIEKLLDMANTNSRAEIYDSLREYLSNQLTMQRKDFNPAAVDFLMNKTNINHQDQSRVSDVLGCFLNISRELLSLAAMHVRGAVGIKITDYRVSHICDYRRDALVLEVVYA